jgi:8-hydroxy-5-deazaflavin:NADPH oxidoreductase
VRIAVLGTGTVGRTIGTKLVELGHEVTMGSRTADNENAREWVAAAGGGAAQGTFEDAASGAELVFNCTGGAVALDALRAAGGANLAGKVVVDASNPLDFSQGVPPTLTVCNTDSVGEQIQREFPDARVVKTLNTVNTAVMTNPAGVPGSHNLFMSGNDAEAKTTVKGILGDFGWPQHAIIDLGDITGARGQEMYLPLWLRLMGRSGGPDFNIAVVHAGEN